MLPAGGGPLPTTSSGSGRAPPCAAIAITSFGWVAAASRSPRGTRSESVFCTDGAARPADRVSSGAGRRGPRRTRCRRPRSAPRAAAGILHVAERELRVLGSVDSAALAAWAQLTLLELAADSLLLALFWRLVARLAAAPGPPATQNGTAARQTPL